MRAELWLESRRRCVKRDVTFQAVTEQCETHRDGSGSTFGYRERDGRSGYLQEGAMLEHPPKSQIFRC